MNDDLGHFGKRERYKKCSAQTPKLRKPMCGYEDGIKVYIVVIVCSSGHGRRKGFGTPSKPLVAHPIISFGKLI